jgi:hypothetical protein
MSLELHEHADIHHSFSSFFFFNGIFHVEPSSYWGKPHIFQPAGGCGSLDPLMAIWSSPRLVRWG